MLEVKKNREGGRRGRRTQIYKKKMKWVRKEKQRRVKAKNEVTQKVIKKESKKKDII
jgi:hypothetical protein